MAYITFQPSDYFKTKIYTGTGSSNAVTGVGFQPDWVWFKNRSTADGHRLIDVIRGVTKEIYADNVSYTEQTEAQGLTAFGADGFTVGTAADYNGNGNNIVAWNWKAGGTGSSNSDGSISSTVSVNNTAGFSIVKYTGTGSNATVGHGLNTAPTLVIIRNYSRANENWRVGFLTGTVQGTGASDFGASAQLDNTGGLNAASNIFNDTAPTSTVFSVGTAQSTNYSGDNLIAYVFAEKKGFSKIGVYTGNNNTNGAFVYTGFKPGFLMIKNYGASGQSWNIHDNERLGSNPRNYQLYANSGSSEDTNERLDLLSNGFKIRTTSGDNNHVSGYFYMAFAEEPLVSSNNIPATAR